MFGPSYLTIGAYISNGGVYCPSCWKTPDDSDASYQLEQDAAVSVAQLEEAYSDEGLWCDDCGREIVEPPDEDPEPDYEYYPEQEGFVEINAG